MRKVREDTVNANTSSRIGPRAKCSQVVYEAIAKACEIIVHSRIQQQNSSSNNNLELSAQSANAYNKQMLSTSSTRFNIEVEEIPHLRLNLQRFRRSLHVPIQLDIFYDDELFERWCINYQESCSPSSVENYDGSSAIDATIPLLRQVCKRVVILLRTLHCMAKLLPAYQYYLKNYSPYDNKGYYDEASDNVKKNQVRFTINAANGTTLKTAKLSQKHDFIPIPTPYGILQLHVLYLPKQSIPKSIHRQKQLQPIHEPIEQIEKKEEVTIIQNYTPIEKKRVLSGLSLALMNDTSNQQQQPEPQQELTPSLADEEFTNTSSASSLLRMHSLDEASHNYWGKHSDNLHRSKSERHQEVFSGQAASNSPRSYFMKYKSLSGADLGSDTSNNATPNTLLAPPNCTDYGYAYNNITLQPPINPTRPIRINKSSSPIIPIATSATPPFSRSPGAVSSVSPCLSSTPPFSLNPTTLIKPRKSKLDDNVLQPPPQPPLALDVLQESPFKIDRSSYLTSSTTSALANNSSFMNNSQYNYEENTLLFKPLNSAKNKLIEDDMPFATTQNSSIYESIASSTSFAHKCAIDADFAALQLSNVEDHNAAVSDVRNQLKDFHSFSASLTSG